MRTVLGFDFGMKHIGVAVGQEVTRTASALPALSAKSGIPDWDAMARLLQQWHPDIVVVGLPLNMDGTDQDMTHAARRFANRLHGRFGVPVALHDERLTTFEALHEMGLRDKMAAKNRTAVDSVSAQIILQSWLEQQ